MAEHSCSVAAWLYYWSAPRGSSARPTHKQLAELSWHARPQVNDTVMFDIETGKVKDFIKFDVGQLVMVTGGRNVGRVGTIVNRQRHKGSFDIILVKDSVGHEFATR